jgi:tripartite-type tricarboxylate transporter receptor subunit TctC
MADADKSQFANLVTPEPALERPHLTVQFVQRVLSSVPARLAAYLATVLFMAWATTLDGAVAQSDVSQFYAGKRINLIVGYGPGGGYDLAARLVARHIGRFIPGEPTVVVQNMVGAGSLRAANYLFLNAPKDGATIGAIGSDVALIGMVGANASVRFDPRAFTWLGSSSSFAGDAYVLLARADAAAPTLAAARRPDGPPLVLGGTGEGARDADVPKILRDALGLHVKQVLGYPDSPSLFLAVERGEIEGRTFDFSSIRSARPLWLRPNSGFNILLQFARSTRHPELPQVPTARELAPNDEARALIEFAEAPLLAMARPFVAPPGIAEDRAEALRAAFLAVHRDPAFLEEAAKYGLDVSPVSWADVAHAIARLAQAPPAVLDYMRGLLTRP